jgi:hypothetical protein
MWTGELNWGYGRITLPSKKRLRAHRLSWSIHFGPVPEGLYVCHHCDNKRCVRPDHLFLGTPQENIDDAMKKGRMNNGDRRNRPYKRGVEHHNSKLTPRDIVVIRKLLSKKIYQRTIADRFGVNRRVIWQIKHRLTWAHVP